MNVVELSKPQTGLTWNKTSLECYRINCNCYRCYYSINYPSIGYQCQMNKIVQELVNTIGVPNEFIRITEIV